jgi:2-dehydropantoate 2-reductase
MTAVADAYGIRRLVTIDKRLEIARGIGPVKVSMLQDLELGRAMEIEPLLGAFLELAAKVGAAAPLAGALYALLTEMAANLPAGRS